MCGVWGQGTPWGEGDSGICNILECWREDMDKSEIWKVLVFETVGGRGASKSEGSR